MGPPYGIATALITGGDTFSACTSLGSELRTRTLYSLIQINVEGEPAWAKLIQVVGYVPWLLWIPYRPMT